jgi:anaerobic magnesium-protoporphyrin IX monomethyl ester cyclase
MTRRRVVLYNPRAVFYTMPLGLLAVGSHLDPSRYEVVIVDGRLETDPCAAVVAALDGAPGGAIALGVSVLTGAPIHDAIEVSRAAKARFPLVPIVWGGWHPSLFPDGCLEEPAVDVTVQAQGEETFAEILERIEEGRSFAGCPGCTYRQEGGRPLLEAPRPLSPVSDLAPHDYSLLPVERYFALKGRRQLDYVSSQGCFFRCAFCADPFVFNRKWVGLSPARVGEELERLHRLHGFTDVNFQDETFFTYLDRVAAIADELTRRRLPSTWAATMRADQGDRLTDDVWAACKRSGLRRLLIGVEAGTQEMVDRIRKDIRLEQVIRCAERCRRHGIAAQFPFIVSFPEESDASIVATLDFARRLAAMSPTFQTPIFFFKPYPGTPLTEEAVRRGYRPPASLDEWARFDFYEADSPWVTPERASLVTRFRWYQKRAYDGTPSWKRPLAALARWRCERRAFGFPIEKSLGDIFFPEPALS